MSPTPRRTLLAVGLMTAASVTVFSDASYYGQRVMMNARIWIYRPDGSVRGWRD